MGASPTDGASREDDELELKIAQYRRTFVTSPSLWYFTRYWNERRGDRYDEWGNSWWYFEVDPADWVVRQIEKYDRGTLLGYDSHHDTDNLGELSHVQLDELDQFTLSSAAEFNVEPLAEYGIWWAEISADAENDPNILNIWRRVINWFGENNEISNPVFVRIGDRGLLWTEMTGSVLPRLAVGLTKKRSLVGIFGYSVQT